MSPPPAMALDEKEGGPRVASSLVRIAEKEGRYV